MSDKLIADWHEAGRQWYEAGRQLQDADRQLQEVGRQWDEAGRQWHGASHALIDAGYHYEDGVWTKAGEVTDEPR